MLLSTVMFPSVLPSSLLLSAAVSLLAVELDQERITENQKVHTLTYDLSNDKHLFAFYTFLIQTNHMEVFPSLSLSLTYSKDTDMKWLIK